MDGYNIYAGYYNVNAVAICRENEAKYYNHLRHLLVATQFDAANCRGKLIVDATWAYIGAVKVCCSSAIGPLVCSAVYPIRANEQMCCMCPHCLELFNFDARFTLQL
ncbi:hypothetical protein Zmor_007149 [Zophobas morio]|uniref:Uncharacterized protein n=1 Tax=Zophobas morio TaxID=2755281 RepID=A0AA38IXL2_9CUCU|nr:hypothetical protein Zmor_007149 [Zophobas morio]